MKNKTSTLPFEYTKEWTERETNLLFSLTHTFALPPPSSLTFSPSLHVHTDQAPVLDHMKSEGGAGL